MEKLSRERVKEELGDLPEWKEKKSVISRVYQFKDFAAAMKFVSAVAKAAEKANHHPDIDIRWNKVTLALTTHDAGGLTENDFKGAHQYDKLAKLR